MPYLFQMWISTLLFSISYNYILQHRKSHLLTALGPFSGPSALGVGGKPLSLLSVAPLAPELSFLRGWKDCGCWTVSIPCLCHPPAASFVHVCRCILVSGNNIFKSRQKTSLNFAWGLGSHMPAWIQFHGPSHDLISEFRSLREAARVTVLFTSVWIMALNF